MLSWLKSLSDISANERTWQILSLIELDLAELSATGEKVGT